MNKAAGWVRNFFRTLDWAEVWRYFIIGVCSTAINVFLSFLLKEKLGIDVFLANIIAWIGSVTFAFLANSFFVFRIKPKSRREFFSFMAKFFGERVFTLGVEEVVFLLFYTLAGLPYRLVKIGAQVIVIGLNYIISKFLVFRHRSSDPEDASKND